MADNNFLTMAKMIMTIALIAAIATQMPGAPPNPGWTALETTIASGFPSFHDPFAPQTFNAQMTVASTQPCVEWDNSSTCLYIDTNQADNVYGTNGGCTFDSWWLCAQTDDNASSFFVVNATGESATDVNLTGSVQGAVRVQVVSMTMTIACRSNDSSVPALEVAVQFDPNMILTSKLFQGFVCPSNPGGVTVNGTAFQNTSIDLCAGAYGFCTFFPASGGPDLNRAIARFLAISGVVDITYVRIDYSYYFSPVDCSVVPGGTFGLDQIACYIGQGVDWAIKAIQWAFFGLIFVFSVAGWGAALIFEFVATILFAMGWPLTIGAPPIVAGLLAVIVFGMYGYIVIWLVSLVRGTGTTG